MKTIITEFGRSLVATIFFALICCGLYPLIIFGVGQLAFPHQANGSVMLDKQGNIRGSELLGQNFTGEKYFHPRPSAAGNGYDPNNSGGSNLGPTSGTLYTNIMNNIAAYRSDNPNLDTNAPVPADAVTASGSGLDPDITVANAEIQIPRVAKQRGLSEDKIRDLVTANTRGRDLGLFGEPRVNVTTLNFALDGLGK
jgi:potassium-transporting ATPase KdpC subunit